LEKLAHHQRLRNLSRRQAVRGSGGERQRVVRKKGQKKKMGGAAEKIRLWARPELPSVRKGKGSKKRKGEKKVKLKGPRLKDKAKGRASKGKKKNKRENAGLIPKAKKNGKKEKGSITSSRTDDSLRWKKTKQKWKKPKKSRTKRRPTAPRARGPSGGVENQRKKKRKRFEQASPRGKKKRAE